MVNSYFKPIIIITIVITTIILTSSAISHGILWYNNSSKEKPTNPSGDIISVSPIGKDAIVEVTPEVINPNREAIDKLLKEDDTRGEPGVVVELDDEYMRIHPSFKVGNILTESNSNIYSEVSRQYTSKGLEYIMDIYAEDMTTVLDTRKIIIDLEPDMSWSLVSNTKVEN